MADYDTPLPYLLESLNSVLLQTFRDYELILVDDGSSNDVRGIVASLADPRLTVIHHPENRGLVAALNSGLRAARAPLVARMDTDDVYQPDHLAVLVRIANEHPDFAVVSTRGREFSQGRVPVTFGVPGEKTVGHLARGETPLHPATLMRKTAVEAVGGYSPKYGRAEDFALWCEMAIHGQRLLVAEEITFLYRVSLADYSKRSIRNRGGEIKARMHYYPLLKARPIDYLRILRTIAGGVLPPRLVRYLRHRELRVIQ